jgi:hypothetical protein
VCIQPLYYTTLSAKSNTFVEIFLLMKKELPDSARYGMLVLIGGDCMEFIGNHVGNKGIAAYAVYFYS